MNIDIHPHDFMEYGDRCYFNDQLAILLEVYPSGFQQTLAFKEVFGQFFMLSINDWPYAFPVKDITKIYLDPTKQDPNINNSRPVYSISWDLYEYPNKPE